MFKNLNKYDKYLILLIASLAAGNQGGAMQPVRLIGLALIPQLATSIKGVPVTFKKYPKIIVCWCLIWICCSFLWSTAPILGIKEIIYYFVHFSIFLEIIVFSFYANKPYSSVSKGWVIAFFLTSIIAVWEFATNNHLHNQLEEGATDMMGGEAYLKVYAASTFYNYNDYETFICYCMVFILYIMLTAESKKNLYSISVVLGLALYIALMNASRGALLSLIVMLALCIPKILRKKTVGRFSILIMISALVLFFIRYADIIFMNLQRRMLSTTLNVEDQSRIPIWEKSLNYLSNSLYMGIGPGSHIQAMDQGILPASHNLFVEIILNYGIIIFVILVCALLNMFKAILRLEPSAIRTVCIGAFIALPIYSIINAGYILFPYLYAYFASLYVFIYLKNVRNLQFC